MFALPIFPGRPSIVMPSASVRWTLAGIKKPHYRSSEVNMLALPIFPGSRPPSIVGANELNFCVRDGNRWTLIVIKKPHYRSSEVNMFALPIFPGSRPPSIVGVHELNFCVRDGNRWTLMTINTNYILKLLCSNRFFALIKKW